MATDTELEALRAAVEETEKQHIIALCGSLRGNEHAYPASLHHRTKYICLDIGTDLRRSGKYMIEKATDKVYGIKAYGRIHRGRCCGTVTEFTRLLTEFLPILEAEVSRARPHAVLDRMSVSLEAK